MRVNLHLFVLLNICISEVPTVELLFSGGIVASLTSVDSDRTIYDRNYSQDLSERESSNTDEFESDSLETARLRSR